MEQGPDFWCWFDTTQFSYYCVHPIHAKMFSIQMLMHFSQIVQRVCTLVLFILSVCLCVCVSVCLCGFPIPEPREAGVQTAVSATSARTGMKYKKRDFSLKRFVPKLWRRLLTSSSSGVVSGILVPFFRRN